MTKSRITKNKTKQLIEHALSSSEKMTGTKLAKLIGEPDSRISNAKSGEWRMTEDQATFLIKEFGQPRSKPGVFIRCETAESIKSFIENEANLSKLRHWEKLINYVSSNRTQEKLLEILSKDPTYIPYRDMAGDLIKEPVKPDAKAIFNKFNTFILSNEFKLWLKSTKKWISKAIQENMSYDEILKELGGSFTFYNIDAIDDFPVPNAENIQLPYDASITVFAKSSGLFIDRFTTIDLLLFGSFYYELNDNNIDKETSLPNSFSFGTKAASFIASELKDYVVTGHIVWEEEGNFLHPKKGEPASNSISYLISNRELILTPMIHESLTSNANPDDWQVDCWTTYSVKLYINENCDYSLLIELGSKKPLHGHSEADHFSAREIIIPKIPGLNLFEHLGILREWLELDNLPEIAIKKNIAKAGGYIPGAITL